jgi:hypothetical protein
VLSAKSGTIVASNGDLLPVTVPAGLPSRGVDFGLDALTSLRSVNRNFIHFSTEILFSNEVSFTDGDVLRFNYGVIYTNPDLVGCFEPKARMLGLDALFLGDISASTTYLPYTSHAE